MRKGPIYTYDGFFEKEGTPYHLFTPEALRGDLTGTVILRNELQQAIQNEAFLKEKDGLHFTFFCWINGHAHAKTFTPDAIRRGRLMAVLDMVMESEAEIAPDGTYVFEHPTGQMLFGWTDIPNGLCEPDDPQYILRKYRFEPFTVLHGGGFCQTEYFDWLGCHW